MAMSPGRRPRRKVPGDHQIHAPMSAMMIPEATRVLPRDSMGGVYVGRAPRPSKLKSPLSRPTNEAAKGPCASPQRKYTGWVSRKSMIRIRNVGIAAIAILAAVAIAQDGFKLRRAPKLNEEVTMKLTADVEILGMNAVFTAKVKEK